VVFALGFRLAVCVAWRGTDLVAVAPFSIRRYWGLRILEWAAKDHTDYAGSSHSRFF
jgi:CelD/BcsL family acetyltransferase involved in cellulose biosynthesis